MDPVLEHLELRAPLEGELAELAISATSYEQNATANIPVPIASVSLKVDMHDAVADYNRIRPWMRIHP